jgi:hypothetical protein
VPILRIEHPVPDFDAWKRAFDSDPLDREKAGVRRYRVFRSVDDSNYVMVDLDFDDVETAEAMRSAFRTLWGRVQPEGLIGDQQARIVELLESEDFPTRR